jgi:hypothetical protein
MRSLMNADNKKVRKRRIDAGIGNSLAGICLALVAIVECGAPSATNHCLCENTLRHGPANPLELE